MNYIQLNVRHLRVKNNLTQSDLAKLLGTNKANISTYENGKASPPIPVLEKYAAYFGLKVGDIVDGDLTKENKTGPNMVSEPSVGYGVSVLQRKYEMLTNELEIRREELIILQQAIQGDADALAALQKIDPKLATKLKKLLDCA